MIEKISLLIITRNREKMLSRCLSSLLVQTRMPDEIIVVDNASTDKTKKVILTFQKKLPIRYVLEKQIGIPFARNKGIREACGSILLMLDDDCQADKFWIERMVLAHKKYPKAWVIQGRDYSLPRIKAYSLLAEYHRYLHLRNYAKKTLHLTSFFSKEFRSEIEVLTCGTKNFSVKTSYLQKYKLSFDTNFYRGEDTDLGKQILQKNGIIMFCPTIKVYHWERSSLTGFLEQRWHIGRTDARIQNKWGKSPKINMAPAKKFLAFLFFCKISNQWRNSPILAVLLFLDKLYYLNGYFYEKRVLSLQKL